MWPQGNRSMQMPVEHFWREDLINCELQAVELREAG